MKRYAPFILLLTLFLLLSTIACNSQDTTLQNNKPTLCSEFNLEGYITLGVHIPKDGSKAYLNVIQESHYDPTLSLGELSAEIFVLTKEQGHYTNPEPFTLPTDFNYSFSMALSPDGQKMYLSAQNTTFFGNDSINLLVGDIHGNTLENLEALDDINTSNAQFVASVDAQQNLIYISNVSERYSQIFYSSYENDSYSQGILMSEAINLDQNQSIGAALSPDGKLIINAQSSYHNAPSPILLLSASKTEEGWQKLSAFDLNINTLTDDNLMPTISGDGKTLYFIRMPSYTQQDGVLQLTQNEVYKISLDAALKQTISDEDVMLNADYDKVSFPLALRNKSDKSQNQGVYYEVFVRSFADSDGDGIGDFNGLTSKLDYLKDLGVDGLWLMPINESPSYHGYDITDYYALNSDYGTEEDFKQLLNEAHKRDMTVIMDFVINHTSSLHPWFVSARFSPSSPYRDYYRFVAPTDTENYNEKDISPWNSSVWHKTGNLYYYGIFTDSMPDLNYNNKAVREEIKAAATKWLELGVDGFRLDAAIHIYGDNEFKQQEQLSSNIQWWNEFALACEKINPNVYLVGEAWQDNDPLADYVQPFDTKFDFSLQADMTYAVKNGLSVTTHGDDLAANLETLLTEYSTVDSNYINGIFAANHDQDRIMSTIGVVEKVKLLANIYLTLPGNPFIYYGEELGMLGSKPDELIRLDFKWTDNPSAPPHTNWMKVMNNKDFSSINADTPSLETQINDTNSMYNHYKKLLSLRKEHTALTSGDYHALVTSNIKVLGYTRSSESEQLWIFHNLSSKMATIELEDLSQVHFAYMSHEGAALEDTTLTLPPYTSVILSQ